jgi:hypothetical protein
MHVASWWFGQTSTYTRSRCSGCWSAPAGSWSVESILTLRRWKSIRGRCKSSWIIIITIASLDILLGFSSWKLEGKPHFCASTDSRGSGRSDFHVLLDWEMEQPETGTPSRSRHISSISVSTSKGMVRYVGISCGHSSYYFDSYIILSGTRKSCN